MTHAHEKPHRTHHADQLRDADTSPHADKPDAAGGDRRHHRRLPAAAHNITAVRIRPGHAAASVVDASTDGALIETVHRLLPGRPVDLHIEAGTHHARIKARVLRCTIAAIHEAAVVYRGAVAFERHLAWIGAHEGYDVPTAEERSGIHERASATRTARSHGSIG